MAQYEIEINTCMYNTDISNLTLLIKHCLRSDVTHLKYDTSTNKHDKPSVANIHNLKHACCTLYKSHKIMNISISKIILPIRMAEGYNTMYKGPELRP